MGKKRFVTALAAVALAGAGVGVAVPAFALGSGAPEGYEPSLFEQIAGDYTFNIGVGGWAGTLNLAADGSFAGKHFDSNAGGSGWEIFICEYTGHLSNLQQVSEGIYSAEVERSACDTSKGEHYDEGSDTYTVSDDGTRFRDGDTVTIYAPGTPVSDVAPEYVEFVSGAAGWPSGFEAPSVMPFVGFSSSSYSYWWPDNYSATPGGYAYVDTSDSDDNENPGDTGDPAGGDSGDPVVGVLASATSPEGWVVSVPDVPENADVNVIELSVLKDPAAFAGAFLFVADGTPDGDGYARVNVHVGKEYAGRQVKLEGVIFTKAAELAGNYTHGVDFGPVIVDADGNAAFDIGVGISGIDPSEYANHDHNEFGDYDLDVVIEGEEDESDVSSDKPGSASNVSSRVNANANNAQAESLPDTGSAAGALAVGALSMLLAGAGLLAMRRRYARV